MNIRKNNMNIVPVAFAFDHNLNYPACVCISSLLMSSKEDTFYDLFILHSQQEYIDTDALDKIPAHFPNCRIQYRSVGIEFNRAFEIRGITVAAYYRLLIPDLIPEYDKIIYSDIDVIFRMDLSELYAQDLSFYYLAATYDWGMLFNEDGRKYIDSVEGLRSGDYIQSGFLLLNSKKIREDGLVSQFKKQAAKNYKFQDQDILNIVCGHCKCVLPLRYNMTDYAFYYIMNNPEYFEQMYPKKELLEAVKNGNIHYNGHKPWKKYSVNFDIWWEYYRKSPFFNEHFYFNFFYGKLNEFDNLSLSKRVKILLRWFFVH